MQFECRVQKSAASLQLSPVSRLEVLASLRPIINRIGGQFISTYLVQYIGQRHEIGQYDLVNEIKVVLTWFKLSHSPVLIDTTDDHQL
jgi:hypothetical protein